MSLIGNERTKLTANLLNSLAAGIIVTGVVAPVVAAIYRVQGPLQVGYVTIALFGVGWLLIGTILHLMARRLLGSLQE